MPAPGSHVAMHVHDAAASAPCNAGRALTRRRRCSCTQRKECWHQCHAVLLTRQRRSRCGIFFARRRHAAPTRRLLRSHALTCNVHTPCSIIPTCMLVFMSSSTSTITRFCNMYTLLILLCNAAGLPMSRAVNQWQSGSSLSEANRERTF